MRRALAGERLERKGGPVRGYIGAAVALVIMGRALDAGSPFHDNGFSNRPIGHAPAGSGLVIMGRAAGPGCPVRPGGERERCRWVLGDHGACAQGRMPVTWQRILQSTDWARAAGSCRVCTAGARSAGSPRCAAAAGLDRWARAGRGVALVIMGRALDAGSPFHDNGFSNRPIGGAPAGSGQVIMGRAVGPGSPVRQGVRTALSVGAG